MPVTSHTHQPVRINGVDYPSIRDAAAALGIRPSTVTKRIRRGEPGWERNGTPAEARMAANAERDAHNAIMKAQRAAEYAQRRKAKSEARKAARVARLAAQRAEREARTAARVAANKAKRERNIQLRLDRKMDEWWSPDMMASSCPPTGNEVLVDHVAYPSVSTAAHLLGTSEEDVTARIAAGAPGCRVLYVPTEAERRKVERWRSLDASERARASQVARWDEWRAEREANGNAPRLERTG